MTRAVDLATMPIYARAGAIIPLDPVRQWTGENVSGPTTLRVYSGADGAFTMYADDGSSENYKENKATWTKLTWDDAAKKLTIAPGPPAGATNEASAPRTFKVQLLPQGTTKDVPYRGEPATATF